ncbi:MAG: metallophosphoesterase, partial [Chloroflexota bacterium]
KAHQGIKAFLWLIKVFQPSYHLHGHIHLYLPKIPHETRMGKTTIINTYGFRELTFSPLSSTSKI